MSSSLNSILEQMKAAEEDEDEDDGGKAEGEWNGSLREECTGEVEEEDDEDDEENLFLSLLIRSKSLEKDLRDR